LRREALAGAGDAWAAELADCVLSCRPSRSAAEPAAAPAARAGAVGVEEPLFSWVIAPLARA
jgi:hypothetical protein